MKIEQLRQMVELSKTRCINKAAANLFISQPNLSMSIRSLEEELHCQLIVRSNKGVSLTSRGEQFVEYAESLVSQFDRLKDICQPYTAGDVAAFSLANQRMRFVVNAAAELYNRHKSNPINLIVNEYDRDGVINAVAKGDCEIGFINILACYKKEILKQIRAKNVQYYRLSVSPATVVVGQGNPLYNAPAELRGITTDMIQDFPHLRYGEMDYGHYSDKQQKLDIPKKTQEIVVDSRAAMYEILDLTDAYILGTTSHTAYSHTSYYHSARSFDILDKNLPCEMGWLKRTGGVPSPLALEFIQIISDYFG